MINETLYYKNYKNKKFQLQIEYDKQDEETQTNAKFTNNLPRKLKNKIIIYKRNYYKIKELKRQKNNIKKNVKRVL